MKQLTINQFWAGIVWLGAIIEQVSGNFITSIILVIAAVIYLAKD